MEKVWYLNIDGRQEGPHSLVELKGDLRITPDTLVWKEGWPDWKPAGAVPELKSLFEDEEELESLDEDEEVEVTPEGELTLDMEQQKGGGPAVMVVYVLLMLIALYYLYSKYGP